MDIQTVLSHDETFRYQLLDRLRQDCEYYLANGGGTRLWAGSVAEQIKYMKAIWKSFPKDKKPTWLKYRQIVEYEKRMTV